MKTLKFIIIAFTAVLDFSYFSTIIPNPIGYKQMDQLVVMLDVLLIAMGIFIADLLGEFSSHLTMG